MSQKFVWKGLKTQVGKWAKKCESCLAAKVTRHIKAPLQTFRVPARNCQHLVGPLSPSHGYTFLFTIVDRFSRWGEDFPLTGCTAQACGKALIHGWLARFGMLSDISSDRGAQFISGLWKAMANY